MPKLPKYFLTAKARKELKKRGITESDVRKVVSTIDLEHFFTVTIAIDESCPFSKELLALASFETNKMMRRLKGRLLIRIIQMQQVKDVIGIKPPRTKMVKYEKPRE